MSAALESRARVLEDHVARLRARYERREPLAVEELEALAEASFRLGVDPATDRADAIAHLYRAYRLDGTNPKYAYHLGRLQLAHGDLDKAAEWLTTAVRLSPTSHRVWTHLGIVQRALNERYHGDPRFDPDALGQRADRISAAVRAGEDSFDLELADVVPPPSRASQEEAARQKGIALEDHETATRASGPRASTDGKATEVRRLTDPGVCRWSGIHDLDLEARYRVPTSRRTRDQLLPELEHVADLAATRRGGLAAFAILAVEWLLCGYPVGTVRRLRAQLPESPDPSLALVDVTCDLFEAEERELRERLAQCLRDETLPATLVALIHHRRLLWRPMTFPDLGVYRAARAFVARTRRLDANGSDELAVVAQEHVRALEAAISAFDPAPPDAMGEPEARTGPVRLDPAAALESLAALEGTELALEQLRADLFGFVKQDLLTAAKSIDGDDAFAAVAADYACACRVLDGLPRAAVAAGEQAGSVTAGIGHLSGDQLGADFHRRLETCLKGLAELTSVGNVVKVLRRVEQQLDAVRVRLQSDDRAPSGRARELAETLEGIRGDEGASRAEDERSPGLAVLEQEAAEITGRLELAWERALALADAERTGEPAAVDAAEAGEIAELVDVAEETAGRGFDALARLRDTGELEDEEALEGVEASYRELLSRVQSLRQQLPRLHTTASEPVPAEREAVDGTRGATRAVEAALERVDRGVDERFAAARATFAAYDALEVDAPPIRALRDLVRGNHAETLYRLGRRHEAQRIWHELLRGDRLNLAALRNVAVSHSCGGEVPQAAQAWQSYLERLCFLDIATGSPRGHAQQRASIHRICAAAYGPRSLAADPKKQEVDLGDVPGFLASAGRVAAFSAHRQLASLNTFLGFHSPTLILGVSRSVDEETLTAARDRQLALVRAACAALPARVREPFARLSARHIEQAYEAAREVERRTLRRERHYKDEEERHLSGLKEAVVLKYRVRTALVTDSSWTVGEQSGDIVGSLRHLDAIELDPGDDLVRLTVESLGVADPTGFLEQLNDLSGLAAQLALRRIFDPGDDGFAENFAERFPRLADSWVRGGVADEYLDVLDDPQPFYPPSVGRAFEQPPPEGGRPSREQQRVVAEALEDLRRWSERFPRATGPARLRATLTIRLERGEEAWQILEEAQKDAFHPKARERCAPLMITALILQREFARARDVLRDLARTRSGGEEELVLLRNLYVGWLNASPAVEPPSWQEIRADFDRWLSAAKASKAAAKLRGEALAAKRELVTHAALASCQSAAGEVDPDHVLRTLKAVRDDDPGNHEALYLQMGYAFRLCGQLSQALASSARSGRPDRSELRKRLERGLDQAEAFAVEFLAVADGGERRAEAERIVTEVRQARS